MALAADWEWDPDESGKTFIVEHTWVACGPHGQRLTIEKGFEYDGYSVAPDLPDMKPAEAHDKAYTTHRWDDDKWMKRKDADWVLLHYMELSGDSTTRFWAKHYYKGVRKLGWWPWWRREIMWMFGRK